MGRWHSEDDKDGEDLRMWAFEYQVREQNHGPYKTMQVTDNEHNIFVRRVKFIQWSQEPQHINNIGVIGRPYCVPGQGSRLKIMK